MPSRLSTLARPSYPEGADVLGYLESLGLRAKAPQALCDRLAGYCVSAAALWERGSLWTPYLSDGNEEDRFFDPPQDTRFLLLGTGLLSCTSLTTGWSGPGTGFTQAAGTGYRLAPQNAAAQGRAYEAVEFLSGGYGTSGQTGYPFSAFGNGYSGAAYGRAGSVKITGAWGRVMNLPMDVWQAVLEHAVLTALPALHLALVQKLLSFSEAGVTETYSKDPLQVVRESLLTSWPDTMREHKRVLVYA